MSTDLAAHLRTLMKDNYGTGNLVNVGGAEFKENILSRIGKDDAAIEGYADPTKQRDLSIRFRWGHDHDFGDFSLDGEMADRHILIIARFLSDFGLPLDLTGKKVLDIGVWTGGTCLALCALGAEVVGLEEVRKYADTVTYLAHAFGLDNLTCEALSVYEYDRADAFDYVLYSGVIYHVTDPVLSLRILYNALKDGGDIFVETFGIALDPGLPPMTMVESPGTVRSGSEGEKSRTGWNYFVPTDKALKLWMETVGFHDVTVAALNDNSRYLAKGTRHAHEEMARAGLARRDIR